MHQDIDKLALLVHGTVAVIAGVVRALKDDKEKILEILTSAIISGFTGTIFGMLAMYFLGENSYLTLSIAGIGGLMGEKGIYFLIEGFKKQLK
jgi:hypothetical protein